MKKIHKFFAVTAAVLMLCGCGSEPSNKTDDPVNNNSEVKKEEVDYMKQAKDFMDKVEIEITMPSELGKKTSAIGYGELSKQTYYSATCEKDRKFNILLPEGYTTDKKYPVMYVLHGIFGTEDSMTDPGTNIITPIGNMIADGTAKEMIVVFPYMYASKTQDVCTAIDVPNSAAYDNFINDLVDDLMPYIEENYSVATGRNNTAVAGFSMGGREALAIGIARPDLFGYICGIAPAPGLVPGKDWAMEHPGTYTEDEAKFDDIMPTLFMVCSGDKDSVVGTFPKSYHELFDKNKVTHIWYEIPGSDHGNPAIQSGIYNFCKYAFTAE